MKLRAVAVAGLVGGLCLVAFGLRAYGLEAKSIWWDESLSLYRARLGVLEILRGQISFPGSTTADLHPPLYFLLLAGFTRLAGESDFALRFPSVAWAVLLVPLFYAAGRRFWNGRAGLLAALLGAASPFYQWYAQEARMYTMVAALGLLALYALDRGVEERRTPWLLTAGLAAAAAAYTHYLALLLVPVLGVRALLAARPRQLWRWRAFLVLAGVAVVTLPVVAYALWRLGLGPEVGRAYVPLGDMAQDALHSFHAGLTLSRQVAWPLDLVALALFLVGALWPDGGRRWLLLWAYVLIPLLGMYAASLVKPLYMGSRYVMLLSPPFYLGVGRGLERLGRRWTWPLALAACLAVLGTMGVATRNYFLDPLYRTKEDYRSAAQAIQLQERPGDAVIINPLENAVAFLHYYRGRLPAVGLPKVALNGNPDRAASDADAAAVAARFDRLWLVKGREMFSDPNGYVEAWLKANAFLVENVVYPSHGSPVSLQLYLTRHPVLAAGAGGQALPSRQHTAEVDFGDLRLEGYDLPLRPVAGDERAWVTLYWRVQERCRNVKVSLRLLDAQGRLWGQADQLPYPAFPPERWPAGALVRHEASLRVPPGVPPGWYRLEMRLYEPESARPIEPLAGAGPGALMLGPLRVDATWARGAAVGRLLGEQHRPLPGGMRFGDTLVLVGYRLGAPTVRPGEWLTVDLYWQVDRTSDRDLTLTLDLIDRRGRTLCSHSASPVSSLYPPSAWREGELLWAQHSLLLPPGAPAGSYRLRISVRDATSRLLPVRDRWRFWTWGQEQATLGAVRVAEVPRVFSRPAMEHALEVQSTAGIDLLGFDGAVQTTSPGQELEVRVHWRAAAVPGRSYKVSLQLLAADRRTILAQEDSIPVQWTRPTNGWQAGEIVSDAHRLVVPAEAGAQAAWLIVALYDEDTGQRVQWLGAEIQDHVVLCPVEIVR